MLTFSAWNNSPPEPTAAPRLTTAALAGDVQAAQLAAINRYARSPAPVQADPDDDRHVDRSEAQDLHAWND